MMGLFFQKESMKAGEEIRVLLIEDTDAIGNLIYSMLSSTKGYRFRIVWVKALSDGKEVLSTQPFDIVILDLSLPDSNGIETLRSLQKVNSEIPVVILTGNEDEGVALAAVAEGAQDYLTKTHWQPESLARNLLFAVERQRNRPRRHSAKQGVILSFIGAKGGVGNTTTALNVAAALASQGKTCIAIELRSCRGSFFENLAHKPVRTLSAIRSARVGITAEFVHELLVDAYPNFRVLHGPKPNEQVDISIDEAGSLLDIAASAADYVVLDLPPYPCTLAEAGVRKSSFTTMVVDREPTAVSMAGDMITLLRSWGVGDSCMGALIVNRSSSMCEGLSAADIRGRLGCGLLGMVTADSGRTPGFHNSLPVTITRPDGLMAETTKEVARRLAAGVSQALPC